MRGGTENVPGAIGMAVAAEAALTHQATTSAHTTRLCDLVHRAVLDALPDAVRLGHADRRLPHILSLRLPGIVGQTLLERCDARGVAFSIGSACHSAGDHRDGDTRRAPENHVLQAIGLDRRASREVVRISFSRFTTTTEAAEAARIVIDEIHRIRAQAPKDADRRERAHEPIDGADRT